MSDRIESSSGWKVSPTVYFKQREAPFGISAQPSSEYIVMKDGVHLAADVYLPQDIGNATPPERVPTMLILTPYYRRWRTDGTVAEAASQVQRYRDLFVPRGYAVMIIDVRGTGASFGVRDALRSPNERNDYGEIAQWIVERSWSNGVIGSTGVSYVGAASCFLASTGHSAVKAIAPLFSVSDIYSEQLFPGGLLAKIWTQNYDDLMIALDHSRADLVRQFAYYKDPGLLGPQPVDADQDGSLLAQAIKEHLNNFKLNEMAPELAYRGESLLHDPSLSLATCSPYHYLNLTPSDVAIYSISGWFDGAGYANGAISRFLTRNNDRDRLLIGPWDHGARINGSPWRAQIAPEFDLNAELLRFFDTHLMNLDTGFDDEAPVHYFNMHAEEWVAAQMWPPVAAKTEWRFDEGALRPIALASASSDKLGTRSYQVDFTTHTGRNTRSERLGAMDVETYYQDWQEREASMLSFDSAPLAAALPLEGHPVVTLAMSLSEGDASIFVYLSEVEADGTVRYITEGMLRALHRELSPCPDDYVTCWPFRDYTRKQAKRVPIGERHDYVIPLLPTAWTLAAGSRLRVSIAGADAIHYAGHPYGRPPVFEISIGDSAGASGILLPVVNEQFRTSAK